MSISHETNKARCTEAMSGKLNKQKIKPISGGNRWGGFIVRATNPRHNTQLAIPVRLRVQFNGFAQLLR